MDKTVTLSLVIPCFNEEKTLAPCVARVEALAGEGLEIEIIIVDDGSSDGSLKIAQELSERSAKIQIVQHAQNMGKGAALRSGFKKVTGDLVAVQDADLEYDPTDLKRLLRPLLEDKADVVFGSRFISHGEHRVLHFWHYLGNRFLTFMSNIFTDLNLTDIETGYKVFRREVVQDLDIQENRFGVEPEIVARVASRRLRIYEMGISYSGRTYEEGKKITAKDGLRALYCIFHYNAHRAPVGLQFLLYIVVGGLAGIINLAVFVLIMSKGGVVLMAAPVAFAVAALVNYWLCLALLFRHKTRWGLSGELFFYCLVVGLVGSLDLGVTRSLITVGYAPPIAKVLSSLALCLLNFAGRRFIVFPEPAAGKWQPQVKNR